MDIVVDVSAIVAVLLNEATRSAIEKKSKGKKLIAPSCLHWEIGNALYNSVKRKHITEKQAINAFSDFLEIPIQLFEVDVASSLTIALSKQIATYDAYYLRCAIDHKRPLLTLDKRMAQIAADLSITVL